MTWIANGESGASVRSKLNTLPMPSTYVQRAVHFDGSASMQKTTALAVANSKVGTASWWFDDLGLSLSLGNLVFVNESWLSGIGVGISIGVVPGSVVNLSVALNSSDAGHVISLGGGAALVNWRPGRLNHALVSWDATASVPQLGLALNGTPIMYTPFPASGGGVNVDANATGDPDFPRFLIGRGESGELVTCNYADVFLDLAHSIVSKNSISAANIAKFIDFYGNPVDLGLDGSTPFGAAPVIYCTGNAASFSANRGTGGAFALTGLLTDA